jgi:tetratricopeptide (TPR) repeat protein
MDLEIAEKARRAGKYKKALEMYKLAIQGDPQSAPAYAGLGLTYIYLKKNDDAFRAANRALELDPKQHFAHITLAAIHHSKGALEQYKHEIERAFSLQPFVYEVGCMYARMLLDDKEFDTALPLFERIIEANPKKLCPRFFLGQIYFDRKDYKKALDEFIKAFRVHPSLSTAITVYSATTSAYHPWSSLLVVALLTLWIFSAFSSKIALVSLGVVHTTLVLNAGILKVKQGQTGWGLFYFFYVVVIGFVFVWLFIYGLQS